MLKNEEFGNFITVSVLGCKKEVKDALDRKPGGVNFLSRGWHLIFKHGNKINAKNQNV